VLEVLYHRVKFGVARISPAVGEAKNVEFFVYLYLSVCSSRFGRQSLLHDFAMKVMEM